MASFPARASELSRDQFPRRSPPGSPFRRWSRSIPPRPCPESRRQHRSRAIPNMLPIKVFFERIADLHRRPVFSRFFRQLTRSKRGAGQTIAPRFRAHVKDRVTDPTGCATSQLFVSQNAEAKNVHQWIAFKAFVEINFTADGRDADAIPVVRNPRNDTGEEPPVGGDLFLRIQLAGRRSAEP